MSKFTEGPWTIETPCGFPYSGLYIVPVVRKDFPFYIAQIRQLREREESEANAELIASAPTLKQQRDDLLDACKKGVAPFSLSQYAERFRELASKPNLAVYRVILGNAAGMFEILESEAKNREDAIAKCEE